MKALQRILFVLGLAFLLVLIWRLGARELWQQFTFLGWGLVPIIVAEGVAEWCHAVSWRYCLQRQNRKMSLVQVFNICMAGYAMTVVTPTASVSGEVTKGVLIASTHKGRQAVTALLVGKVSFAVSHLSLVVIGFVTVLWHVQLPLPLKTALLVGSGLLAAGIITFLLLQKRGKVGWLLRNISRRSQRLECLGKLSESINEIDEALKVFYKERHWDLALSVVWHWVGFSLGIFSTWYFLWLVSGPPSAEVAAGIFFLALWIDLVTFAVPMNLGTLEGSRMLIFRVFHFDPVEGLTFGLAMRAAQLFWVFYGLIIYGLMISGLNRRVRRLWQAMPGA